MRQLKFTRTLAEVIRFRLLVTDMSGQRSSIPYPNIKYYTAKWPNLMYRSFTWSSLLQRKRKLLNKSIHCLQKQSTEGFSIRI